MPGIARMFCQIARSGRLALGYVWRRVRWLPLFLAALLASRAIGHLPPASAQLRRPEIRGVWMTRNDFDVFSNPTKLQAAIDALQQLNFNTIYPVVWNSGYAFHRSEVTQRLGIQSFTYRGKEGQDMLADTIARAHRAGMLVMPWFEFGFMAPPTSELATMYPQWLAQQRDGKLTSVSAAGEVVWLNPLRPEVQQFLTDLVMEVVANYDIDGIQFDDHLSLPSEFGYDRYTVDLYVKETKKPPPANASDPAWVKWRADKLTAFVGQLRQTIRNAKPNVKFSLSPNYYDFAYRMQLQDWLGWVRQNLVDEVVVQIYRPNLQSFIEQIARPEIQAAQQKIPTAAGVLTGLRNSPVPMAQIQAQAQAARDRGLGVSFFYYESLWDRAPEPAKERQAGFLALFPAPAPRS